MTDRILRDMRLRQNPHKNDELVLNREDLWVLSLGNTLNREDLRVLSLTLNREDLWVLSLGNRSTRMLRST